MCGVSTTFGQRASGWSLLRGSGVITSRPAPPILPSCRAKRVLAIKDVWCSPRGLRPKPPDQRVLPWKCWLCRWWAASWTKGSGKRCPLSLGSDLHTFDQDALEWDEHWTHNSWQPNSTKREATQRKKQQNHSHNHSGIQAHTTKNTFQQLNINAEKQNKDPLLTQIKGRTLLRVRPTSHAGLPPSFDFDLISMILIMEFCELIYFENPVCLYRAFLF